MSLLVGRSDQYLTWFRNFLFGDDVIGLSDIESYISVLIIHGNMQALDACERLSDRSGATCGTVW